MLVMGGRVNVPVGSMLVKRRIGWIGEQGAVSSHVMVVVRKDGLVMVNLIRSHLRPRAAGRASQRQKDLNLGDEKVKGSKLDVGKSEQGVATAASSDWLQLHRTGASLYPERLGFFWERTSASDFCRLPRVFAGSGEGGGEASVRVR